MSSRIAQNRMEGIAVSKVYGHDAGLLASYKAAQKTLEEAKYDLGDVLRQHGTLSQEYAEAFGVVEGAHMALLAVYALLPIHVKGVCDEPLGMHCVYRPGVNDKVAFTTCGYVEEIGEDENEGDILVIFDPEYDGLWVPIADVHTVYEDEEVPTDIHNTGRPRCRVMEWRNGYLDRCMRDANHRGCCYFEYGDQ